MSIHKDVYVCQTSPCVHPFPEMLDASTIIPSNIIKMSWNKKPILTIVFIQGNPKVLHLPSLPTDS